MNSEIDSVFTCVAYSYPIQRSLHIVDGRIGMVYPEYMNARSQDLEPIYHDAGQFYFSRTAPLWRAGLLGEEHSRTGTFRTRSAGPRYADRLDIGGNEV